MSIIINCVARASFGTSASRNIRKKGLVPAVIYIQNGTNLNVLISAIQSEILVQGPSFYSHTFTLRIYDEKFIPEILNPKTEISQKPEAEYTVLPRDIQFHPVKNSVTHFDFMIVKTGDSVGVNVPVVFKNREKCNPLKFGGSLIILNYNPKIFASVGQIPEKLEVDLTDLPNEKIIRLSEVNLPEGVTFKKDQDLAEIAGKRGE